MPVACRSAISIAVRGTTVPASIRAMLGGAVADRGDNPSVDEIVTLLAVWLVPLVVLFGVVYLAVRLATRSSRRP